jgi:hypothetical protein
LPSAVVSEANSVSWADFLLFLFFATIITSYRAIISRYWSVMMGISRHDRIYEAEAGFNNSFLS